jgi:uncharacterized protein (DUF885 family)
MLKIIAAALLLATSMSAQTKLTPARLHELANDYYKWSQLEYPVNSSDQGLHTWDDRLTDYSPAAIEKRSAHVARLLATINATKPAGWSKDDTIDWILFRSQLEAADFANRILKSESTNPDTYVSEASNAIFSLLKKEYDKPRNRALSAEARFKKMAGLFEQAKKNLTAPIRLHSEFAMESARAIDPLFKESIDPLARDLNPAERKEFDAARDRAIKSAHDFADWLEKRLPSMKAWAPMGETNYNFMLHRLLLLPLDAHDLAHLGEVELVRYRALESWLPDPSLADPDPKRAAHIPADQQEFLAAYQSREEEMIKFLRDKHLVTLPDYIGPFLIKQLPEAFRPTSPGGFMNPPGLYDKDNSGFYFIPTYNPNSKNFYIRAAIEDPRPLLGHEGIPGHFLQISISNHLKNEIRRQQGDGVFAEGWALYGEEMLMREGLYPDNSAGQAQILRLARYRAARIGVDVNLQTGRWTFPQAVDYFMDGGGLDKEAATGEAAGAAASPTQKICYITGKWQIQRILGRYRDRKGAAFRLGEFHDELISYGSLPLSVIAWIMLDDPTDLEKATGMKLR